MIAKGDQQWIGKTVFHAKHQVSDTTAATLVVSKGMGSELGSALIVSRVHYSKKIISHINNGSMNFLLTVQRVFTEGLLGLWWT